MAVPSVERRNISEFTFHTSEDVEAAYRRYLDSRVGWIGPSEPEEGRVRAYGVLVTGSDSLIRAAGFNPCGIVIFTKHYQLSKEDLGGPSASIIYNINCKPPEEF